LLVLCTACAIHVQPCGTPKLKRLLRQEALDRSEYLCSTDACETCPENQERQFFEHLAGVSSVTDEPIQPEIQEIVSDDIRPVLTVELMGGLGNQIYQLAMLLTVARSSGHQFSVSLRNVQNVCCNRNTFWDTIFRPLKPLLVKPNSALGVQLKGDSGASACRIAEDGNMPGMQNKSSASDNYALKLLGLIREVGGATSGRQRCQVIVLKGYWQHNNYFVSHLPWLRRLFWNEDIVNRARQLLEGYADAKNGSSISSVVSIHYRVGDTGNARGEIASQTESDRYHVRATSEAKRRIMQPLVCLIFSDSPQIALKRSADLGDSCSKRVLVGDSVDDITQFYLMSIAPTSILEVSTYSYWAALLSPTKQLVIYPEGEVTRTRWAPEHNWVPIECVSCGHKHVDAPL